MASTPKELTPMPRRWGIFSRGRQEPVAPIAAGAPGEYGLPWSPQELGDNAARIDADHYRQTLGRFATGVTVVTTAFQGRLSGFTANSFTSVSINPPLVLVCPNNSSGTLGPISWSRTFCINVLSVGQLDLARIFASRGREKDDVFEEIAHRPGQMGAPIFADSLAWIDCKLTATYPGGDHVILVGEVMALDSKEGTPLLYFQSHYNSLPEPYQITLRHRAVSAEELRHVQSKKK